MNSKQLFCKLEKSTDGRLSTGWYALLGSRLNANDSRKPATNAKQKIRKAVALTALALAATSAQAIDLRSWDKKINNASERFQAVLDGQAVLDKETQLVWERSPSKRVRDWGGQSSTCISKNVGGRQGWRMPTVDELHSLRDPSGATNQKLPAGHPFVGITTDGSYWTATSEFANEFRAYLVDFDSPGLGTASKTLAFPVWCVRGAGGRAF